MCFFCLPVSVENYNLKQACLTNTMSNINVTCSIGRIHVHSAFLGWSPTNSCEKHSDDCHFAFYAPHAPCEGRQECDLNTTLLKQPFNGQDCENSGRIFISNYLELTYDCLQGTSMHLNHRLLCMLHLYWYHVFFFFFQMLI